MGIATSTISILITSETSALENVHLTLDEQVMLIGLSTSNSFLGAMLQSVLRRCFGEIMKGKRSQVPVPITTKSWYGDIRRRKADLQKD